MTSLLIILLAIVGDPLTASACSNSSHCNQERLATDCKLAVIQSGCNLNWGSRARLCELTRSAHAITTLKAAFLSQDCNISDTTMAGILSIGNAQQAQAAEAIIDSNCNIGWGNRANLILSVNNRWPSDVIRKSFIAQSCNISDPTLSSIVKIEQPFQAACMNAITRAGCNLSWGSRARICLKATCAESADLVHQAMTSQNCHIDDSTLRSLVF